MVRYEALTGLPNVVPGDDRALQAPLITDPGTSDEGHRITRDATDGLTVWLEREGERQTHDEIILERLALAVRVRHGRGRTEPDHRRKLGLLLDQSVPLAERCTAEAALGLAPHASYRIAAAPLFAVWTSHPGRPEDVVPTQFGPIHSFLTALVAVRLRDPPAVGSVTADTYAGLVDLLADQPADAHQLDVRLIERITVHPWGLDLPAPVAPAPAVPRRG